MSKDTIYRQDAIDAITDERIVANMDSVYDSEIHRCKRAMQRILASLPPVQPEPSQIARDICTILENEQDMRVILKNAQPERKNGKWIVYYECPKCGEITKDFTEYCPFCNADMRGEEDEHI